MPKITENKRGKIEIESLGLWDRYKKQKAFFIDNPNHNSLDFSCWNKKHSIWSFKITNQYRVKAIKNTNGSFTVIDAGDYHKPK